MMETVQLTNNQWVWEIFCILTALVIIFLVLLPKGLSMVFFGPALFGAGYACRRAGVTIAYGALLLPRNR